MAGTGPIKAGNAFVEMTMRDRISQRLRKISSNFKSFGASVTRIGASVATIGAGTAAGLATIAIKAAAEAESTKIAFEVMLGSAERAETLIKKINAFLLKTPFTPQEVRSATCQRVTAKSCSSSRLSTGRFSECRSCKGRTRCS